MNIFLYGYCIFFIAIHAALVLGFLLEWLRGKKCKHWSEGARVSVIIPVHNEDGRMGGLLRTLLVQSYGAQIIFVDDRSTDKSPVMLAQFAEEAEQRGIDCRIITLSDNPGPNHKQFALCRGIAEADGDYFLFTDGDCEVPPDWIRLMVYRILDGETGAVTCPVFKKKQGDGFFFLYQCFDHAIRYFYLAGAAGLGAAGGGFGNNLIISKKALQAAGGYDAIPPSPTEDAALISQIRRMGSFRVRSIVHTDAAVETETEKSWRAFLNQTLRWNNGGLFSPEALTRFNYNLLMLLISAGILAIPFLPFFPALLPMPTTVFLAMTTNTVMVFCFFHAKLPKGRPFFIFLYFLALLFTPVYFTLMTLMGYARIKTKWKK